MLPAPASPPGEPSNLTVEYREEPLDPFLALVQWESVAGSAFYLITADDLDGDFENIKPTYNVNGSQIDGIKNLYYYNGELQLLRNYPDGFNFGSPLIS